MVTVTMKTETEGVEDSVSFVTEMSGILVVIYTKVCSEKGISFHFCVF